MLRIQKEWCLSFYLSAINCSISMDNSEGSLQQTNDQTDHLVTNQQSEKSISSCREYAMEQPSICSSKEFVTKKPTKGSMYEQQLVIT